MTPWADMPLHPDTSRPIEPRGWQVEALPRIVDSVRRRQRPVCVATMGSGKSFLLAELCHLAMQKAGPDRVVVVATPTQKLVRQLSETIALRCGAANVGQFYGKRKQPARRVVIACYPSLPALCVEFARLGRRVALVLVDECHKAEGPTVKEALPALAAGGMVGVTATPFRSVDTESLSHWTELVYRYTFDDAKRDGVLVPYIPKTWQPSGDEPGDLDPVCLDLIRAHGEGPGIVSATSIADAEAHAAFLVEHGVPAEAIHSELSDSEQDRRIARLRSGELRCLVHVSMLSEGIDFPWLRWICLRRPVGAKVRFVQEIGRVLRSDPRGGKTHAIVMDPHWLLGSMGLDHPDALGEALQEAVDREEARERKDGPSETKPLPAATAVGEATVWARMMLLSMQGAGLAAAKRIEPGGWCTRRPSDRQISALAKLSANFARFLPPSQREAVKALAKPEIAWGLQRGAVSDLIDVLKAVADKAPRWPERKHWRLDWPEDAVVDSLTPEVVVSLPLFDRETGEMAEPKRRRKVA